MNKIVLALSAIVSLRFFGLFVVLPTLSLYAINLGATPLETGLIMGGYALTQMIFLYPFGRLSDKFPRKGVILIGLAIFVLGSILCAIATTSQTLLMGRLLQGAGSIGSVVTAMISDFTTEEKRGKAMAMMGGMIAMSFLAAMIIGPVVAASFGNSTLFWITALLGLSAMAVMAFVIPTPPIITHDYDTSTSGWKICLNDTNLQKMNGMVFLHAAYLTMAFMIIPTTLVSTFQWAKDELWIVYAISVLAGILAMGPAAVFGEKYNKTKLIFLLSISLFGLAFLVMGDATTSTMFVVGAVLFYVGFMMQEPLLQSTASKFSKVHLKGTALGIFNTFQSLGAFTGGVLGGYVLTHFSLSVLGTVTALISLLWFGWTLQMENPTKKGFLYIPIEKLDTDNQALVASIPEILESYTNVTEGTFVIKYDNALLSEDELKEKLHLS